MAAALALQRAWLRRGPLALALWPLSIVFGSIAALRRRAFRAGLLRSERVPVPVIVIGNVVAGGAGKTPLVIDVVRHLRQRGLRPGVISRGHGRRERGCRAVRPGDDPAAVGDEPLLIARTGAPVFVGRSRVAAAQALLAAHPDCTVIVSDDGLQHYRLARDMEICVFDDRGVGNGWLLPAGLLREPWPRRADLVVRTAASGVAGYDVRRRLAPTARRADGAEVALAALAGRPVAAIAAIGHPQAFFDMLRAQGIEPRPAVARPDHDELRVLPPQLAGLDLVCTEKDAVKLWRQRPDAWAVRLVIEIDPAFWVDFDRLLDAKLSSPHGLETA